MDNDEQDLIDFQAALDLTIGEVYPVLVARVKTAQFAGWQRRAYLEKDLAQQACAEFYAQCMKNRKLPDNALSYLVEIAKRIGGRQYKEQIEHESLFSPLDDDLADKVRTDEVDDDGDDTNAVVDEARKEALMIALDKLPARQREAFELWYGNSDSTYAELGRRMGITEDGFRKNFDRACDALETLLGPQKE